MRILFTPLIAGKPWNGKTLTTEPLGGSESAVGYLARALARRGHECIVYTHGAEGVFDGVQYRNQAWLPFLGQEKADVHISSRWSEIIGAVPNVPVILWLHDITNRTLLRGAPGDKLVFLSESHVNAMLTPESALPVPVFIIGNGVDNADFLPEPLPLARRQFGKLMWTSNPDRGLHVAARILQELRQKWPDLTLHIFGRAAVYGWGPEAEVPFYPRAEDLEGLVVHEPLNKAALAQVLKTAWCLFYPTTWPETFCIATLEAQAAGTPVIAAPYGALTETVKGGITTYDFDEAIEQLQNPEVWNDLSNQGRRYAAECDWMTRAQQWEEVFNA
mgnify:CR=1 FL=1